MKTHLPVGTSDKNNASSSFWSYAKNAFLLICFSLFSFGGLNAQCDAKIEFNFDNQNTLNVIYADSSIENFTTWQWSFGDGQSSTMQHPTHLYAQAGDYQVQLTASNASCSDTKDMMIHVTGSDCSANFDGHTDPNEYKHVFGFSRAQDINNQITSWSWDFGDQTTLVTTADAEHTYANDGTYNICLTIGTAGGCSDSFCQPVEIAAGSPNCNANFNHSSDPNNYQVLTFNDMSTPAGINSWSWTFGDGGTATTQSPVHTFTDGSYEVCLAITDVNSCSSSWCDSIMVSNQPPACNAQFTFHQDASDWHKMIFEDQSQGAGLSFQWDFGDGQTSTLSNTNNMYTSEGDYNVTLIISGDNGCADTISQMVGVHPDQSNCGGEAHYVFQQDQTNPLQFVFTDDSNQANVASRLWKFGDGTTSTVENPTHIYGGDGNYNVCLELTFTDGCIRDWCLQVSVSSSGCTANFGGNMDTTVQTPNTILFDNLSNANGTITGYSWDFGDGSTSTVENPSHQFGTGNYNVCLTITDDAGCSHTHCQPVDMNNNNCNTNFFFQQDPNDYQKYLFTDQSNSNSGVMEWSWDFGDGNSSTLQNPNHQYTADGTYAVCLTTLSQDSCESTWCMDLMVQQANGNNPPPPTGCFANFLIEHDTTNHTSVNFIDQSNSNAGVIASWSWDFGDNQTGNGPNVNHQFPANGNYDVCLTITDTTGCSATHCMNIVIQPLDQQPDCFASFTFAHDTTTANAVQFYASGSSNLTGGYWDFGDGTTNDSQSPYHVFPGPGFYNVCITVFDSLSGCQNQFCTGVEIGDPTQGDPNNGCFAEFDFSTSDLTLAFNDQSQGNITGWFWNFGDGNTSNDQNPIYTYSQNGYYDVCLDIMDSVSGCQAHFCKPIDLVDTNTVACNAQFYFVPGSAPNEVLFNNASAGAYTNAHWNFGDGGYSDDINPSHIFNQGGFQEVCLTVYDSISGCQATYCDQLNLGVDSVNNNQNCIAEFSHFIDASGAVAFNDASQGSFTNWHWQFGDGTSSNAENPTHLYTGPGFYDVCLTVFDSISGCQGHVCHPVNLQDTTGTNNNIMCHADFDYYTDPNGDVHFNNLSSGNLTNGHWQFGDGMMSDQINPVHNFNPGMYEVCVTVFDSLSGCMDNYCEMINVVDTNGTAPNQDCFSEFNFFPTGNGYEVAFNNASQGSLTNWHWEFGDGTFSNDQNPTHVYTGPGYYQVCLGVMDSINNCMAYICHDVQIGDASQDSTFTDCFAQFAFFPEADGSVHFENNSQGNFTNVHWAFGDMTFSDMYSPSHMFPGTGEYEVCLQVMDSINGCMAEYCDIVFVTAPQDSSFASCEATFNYIPGNGSNVNFNSTAVGSFTNVHWEFGNLGYSDELNPTFTFPGPGVYNVCFGIMDSTSGCMDYTCQPVQVAGGTIDSTMMNMNCFAQFNSFTDPNGVVVFNDASTGSLTNWHWNFGDGTFSDLQSPDHSFGPGSYQVCLQVMDSVSGCMAEYCEDVHITDPNDSAFVMCNAAFNFFPTANGGVEFENLSSGMYTDFYWQFTDGATSQDTIPSHMFNGPGVHGACLTIMDAVSGCQDQYCEEIVIAPDTTTNDVYCEAAFEAFPISETEVSFVNTSFGTYTDVFWQFSNGEQGYDNQLVVDFGAPGMVEACLTVMDSVSGCQATFCDQGELVSDTTVYCNADFTYFPNGNLVSFDPMATGTVTNIMWDFGDGFNSNEMYPEHDFYNGYYNVCLTVFDSISGCMATYCEEINVNADQVIDEACQSDFSYFIEQDTAIVQFSDQSTGGATTWYWSFGDGSPASSEQNPMYTYAEDGYYEVCLTVFTDNGCQESFCQVIAVGDVSNSCYSQFNYFADAVSSTAHFDNISLGDVDQYHWEFGDGMESFQYMPSHTYADTGYYAACLTISSTVTGCDDIFCEDVRVGNAVENPCLFDCVWPGDANNDLEANHYDLLVIGLNYGETGPARDSISTNWVGHYGLDWSSSQMDGVNNKNGDCDGDGAIDVTDIDAIIDNFAFSHPDQPRVEGESLTFEILTPSVTIGEDIEIAVMAGDSTDISMYGVGFEFTLDETMFDFSTLQVDYSNSWLGDEGTDMITIDHPEEALGQIFIALSRQDHIDQVGHGEICRLTIRAIGIDQDGTDVGLTTDGGMGSEGDSIPFTAGAGDDVIINSILEEFVNKDLIVYPNPTQGNLNFNLPAENSDYTIEIFDQLGSIVYRGSSNGGAVNVQLDGIASGLYMIEVRSDNVKYSQRFNVVR